MDLMQDGVISHTVHTTLNIVQAHTVNVLSWSSKMPNFNSIEHILDG